MSLSDEQWEFLKDISLLISYAEACNVKLTGGELYRTVEQQKLYVQQKLSKTMNSKHLKRLAMDFNLFIDGELRTDKEAFRDLAFFWSTLSPKNESGYDWGWDYGHFERQP